MIDLEKQKRIGIKQAKKTIANIYKKAKAENRKPTAIERDAIQHQQTIVDRWQRTSKRGWKI